jgi:hypothetical protein
MVGLLLFPNRSNVTGSQILVRMSRSVDRLVVVVPMCLCARGLVTPIFCFRPGRARSGRNSGRNSRGSDARRWIATGQHKQG